MSFKIKIDYMTGDSYSSEDCEQLLDESWENLDIAKENLKRIDAHYKYMSNITDFDYRQQKSLECPKFLKEHWKSLPELIKTTDYGKKIYKINYGEHFSVPLLKDDGSIFNQSTYWLGYFEMLYGASIIQEPKDGWSFSYV